MQFGCLVLSEMSQQPGYWMKCGTHRMNLNNFGDPLMFHLALTSRHHFNVSSRIEMIWPVNILEAVGLR